MCGGRLLSQEIEEQPLSTEQRFGVPREHVPVHHPDDVGSVPTEGGGRKGGAGLREEGCVLLEVSGVKL